MMRSKRSPIWCYFDLVDGGDQQRKFGSCKYCSKKVISCMGSTSSMAMHLKSHHQEVFQEFKQKQQDRRNVASENSVATSDRMENVEINSPLILPSSPEITEKKSFETSSLDLKDKNQSEKIVLAGDDFGNDLMYFFKELANDEDFTNVTLVTDGGRTIKAHKVVLSAFSPFFKNLLVNNVHQHPLLYLRGVQHEDLRAILDFIYLGQTKVEMNKVDQFINLATDLQIKGLRADPGLSDETNKSKVMEDVGEDDSFDNDTGSVINEEVHSVIKEETVEFSYLYSCHLCDYQAQKKSNLMCHVEITHKGVIDSCDSCDFYATNRNSLWEHKEKDHSSQVDDKIR